MKKYLLSLILVLALLVSCSKEDKVIKVAAASFPMTDIVNIAKEDLEKQGYKVEVTTLTDYVTANIGLNNKEFDANFHQHEPFMKIFNAKNNGTLVKVKPIYDVFIGFYSKNLKNKNEIKNGMKIAIPNDPTNQDRALRILEKENLIKLNNKDKDLVSLKDVDNYRKFNILAVPIPSLVQAYQESDLAFNWPAHMKKIGVSVEDALFLEEQTNGKFAIILASREDNKDSKKVQDLTKAMTSDKVKKFIQENYKGQGFPVF